MNKKEIQDLLLSVKNGNTDIESATQELTELPFKDLEFAKIDNHRELRTGYPEVIYCPSKTDEQILEIISYMNQRGNNILATRAKQETYELVKKNFSDAKYNKIGKTITILNKKIEQTETSIAIITAGTSDMAVAEEAVETAEMFGNKVVRIYDSGVAGIHRLYGKMNLIRQAKVLIVIAGMEGALASVVAGMTDKPIIAVPTSIGYGANFGGISALLAMLTSCANSVTVVNIDNGFGAAYSASIINKL
ncbi:MAG: 1-(5-phosphoribosyl)-5-amino-4-imidazole-carboxylate carboxylase [Bacteroidetes bacterium 4572_117]|nr:MAG: 1-(5-phosphoribosyl)-5-amino-4-imidazole-carboxylate carboxylase [Bacteroidetes bacterium 4572_117]